MRSMNSPLLTHLVSGLLLLLPQICGAQALCTGDCNGDARVAVGELIRSVAIALETPDARDCLAADRNLDDAVRIDELMLSVGNALDGCPVATTVFATAVASDFSSGGYAAVDIDSGTALFTAGGERSASTDSVPRAVSGIVLVINRFGADSITARDPMNDYAQLWECSTGSGSNPQDVVVVNANTAYASLYGSADLLIFDPSPSDDCSDFIVDTIDLSELADDDGIPEMTQMIRIDNLLYVALQKLTNFSPSGPGVVAVIDMNTNQIVDEIELSSSNPFAATKGLLTLDGSLYVPQVGTFGFNDGGLERIDLATNQSAGLVIDEDTLGGDLFDIALVSPQQAYAVVGLADFTSTVVAFNPSTGTLIDTLITGTSIADIEINDRGELYVADRGANGLRVFDAASGDELTTSAIETGLVPFEVAFHK